MVYIHKLYVIERVESIVALHMFHVQEVIGLLDIMEVS